jgi:ATP-dependent DNA helicase DinG
VPGVAAQPGEASGSPDAVASMLEVEVARAFAPGGVLNQADEAYRERGPQLRMALAVAAALDDAAPLVVEAGTGVGKTYAYLVPVLLSGRRALVSTATKALQDQLFLRDLPRLRAALRLTTQVALLKGRASYLCLHRMEQARHDARLPDRWSVRTLARIETWSQRTRTGDLAEVEGLDDRSPVIPLVTSTRDNCLGTECPRWVDCHVVRARREAMAADIVVVNHHLFFADLALRDSGVAELLPTVDMALFDEAHQLVDAGLQFLGSGLGSAQVTDLARDVVAAGLAQARGLGPWQEISAALELAARELRLAAAGGRDGGGAPAKLRWEERASDPTLGQALERLQRESGRAAAVLDQVSTTSPDLHRLLERVQDLQARCRAFALPPPASRVRWIDVSAHGARLVESPLDIRDPLSAQRQAARKAWVFTSATLGDDEALSWFVQGTGLEDARVLRVESPFDYPSQARLWSPADFVLPQDAGHPAAVGRLAAECAGRLSGRTFVLTTTLRALPLVAQALRQALDARGLAIEVLVQGEEPRRTLLQRFGDGQRRVLVGSHSFWEGIDVPGDALQCVLIDKLPFPPPNDPLVQARARRIEEQGGRAFDELSLPEAAVALKQGAGRLIRTETDLGLLVICDPRLVRLGYGRRLRAALPPMRWVGTAQEAWDWLDVLGAG